MDREKILTNIRQHTRGLTSDDLLRSNESSAGLTPSPRYSLPATRSKSTHSLIEQFIQTVQSVGGECIDYRGLTSDDMSARKADLSSAGLTPLDTNSSRYPLPATHSDPTHYALRTTYSDTEAYIRKNHYSDTDIEILHAYFGVAENGACWIVHHLDDDRTRYTLPEHIAIILSAEDIVPTMHEAYEQIAKIGIDDLGVFLSGPSKTADIEQSLVLGAQGAITTKVFLV